MFSPMYLPALFLVLLMQLETGSPLDEISIACILRELLMSLDYLHSEGKIHRDIKGTLVIVVNIRQYTSVKYLNLPSLIDSTCCLFIHS